MEDHQKNLLPFNQKDEDLNEIPQDAFLVIESIKVIPLARAVINIGRRLENDIVIDDPRVSRNHTQLRAVASRYEIHDMNSSGGLYINGMRISKSILYPGDEISLAGFIMVYRQHDAPLRIDLRPTGQLPGW